jgi:DNA repair protein RadC
VSASELMVRGPRGRYRRADKSEVCLAAAQYLVAETRGSYLTRPGQVREFLRVALAGRDDEAFAAVWLDTRHRVLGLDILFTGTIDRAVVHPREIAKRFLERNAAAVILAHNHPSGVLEPSSADEQITQRVKAAIELLDGRVLDHFIVTREGLFAFSEHGLL